MSALFALWHPSEALRLPPGDVYQQLEFGEDVEGLIDLPIQQMIVAVREIFPEATERAGVVEGPSAVGKVSITWSWQWMRLEATDLTPSESERISQLATQFSCRLFEAPASRFR